MIEKYINRIILGDCLDVLRALPSNSIDAVITDPPYCSGGRSIASRQKSTSTKYENNPTWRPDFEGDAKDSRSWLAWCSLWMSECYRVLKEGGVFSHVLRLAYASNGHGCSSSWWHIMAGRCCMEQRPREQGTTQGIFSPSMRVYRLGYKRPLLCARKWPFPGMHRRTRKTNR